MTKIYLDNCCFNRPFDDQQSVKIRVETEAKLYLQQQIIDQKFQLVWSYILDYENSANPYLERQLSIAAWRHHAVQDIDESETVLAYARQAQHIGIKAKDALHLACAVNAECTLFFTTDKGILSKATQISDIKILNPLEWVARMEVKP